MTDAAIDGSNGYRASDVTSIVEQIESLEEDLLSIQGAANAQKKTVKETISIKFEQAEALGMDRKAVKGLLKRRKFLRYAAAIPDKLSDAAADSYGHMLDAVGDFADLPLFKAADKVRERPHAAANAEALDDFDD